MTRNSFNQHPVYKREMKTAKMVFGSVVIIGTVFIGAVACTSAASKTSSGQAAENQAARDGEQLLVNNQPVPVFAKSQERQNLIDLETALAKGAQTKSFMFPMGAATSDGKFDYPPFKVCNSIGGPIATGTELTNPTQVVTNSYPSGGAALTVDQMDPTGVYSSQSSSGTWVMCLDSAGNIRPFYWEGPVATTFGDAKWNPDTKQIDDIGVPSFHFSLIK